MVDSDWELFKWSIGQIHSGAWGRPWVVTFEYGGLSSFFEATTDECVLAEQIPRLYALVKGDL